MGAECEPWGSLLDDRRVTGESWVNKIGLLNKLTYYGRTQ